MMSKSVSTPSDNSAELETRRAARLQSGAALRSERFPLNVVRAAEEAVAVAEAATAEARKRQPSPASACEIDCAWCCYKQVGVSAIEVLRIADHLRVNLAQAEVESIRERSAQWKNRSACPLLQGNRCQAYEVRPLTCRGYNSRDARKCERAHQGGSWTDVPVYAPQRQMSTFALDGLRAATAEANLEGELLLLSPALQIALGGTDVAEKWLAGRAVFRTAHFH